MLSYQRIGVAHAGHRDPGEDTDSPAGSRAMHTLRKLPMSSPKTKTAMMSVTSAGAQAARQRQQRGTRAEADDASRWIVGEGSPGAVDRKTRQQARPHEVAPPGRQ